MDRRGFLTDVVKRFVGSDETQASDVALENSPEKKQKFALGTLADWPPFKKVILQDDLGRDICVTSDYEGMRASSDGDSQHYSIYMGVYGEIFLNPYVVWPKGSYFSFSSCDQQNEMEANYTTGENA